MDESRVGSKGAFSSHVTSIPPELSSILTLHCNVETTNFSAKSRIDTADNDFERLQGNISPFPSAPVYAARLNGLIHSLAAAENAVVESIKARRTLIKELEKLLASHTDLLGVEQTKLNTLLRRKVEMENRKRDTEKAIIRTLPGQHKEDGPLDGLTQSLICDLERPEMEELTPPPLDAPPGSPRLAGNRGDKATGFLLRTVDDDSSPNSDQYAEFEESVTSGVEILSNLPSHRQASADRVRVSKKRRLDDTTD